MVSRGLLGLALTAFAGASIFLACTGDDAVLDAGNVDAAIGTEAAAPADGAPSEAAAPPDAGDAGFSPRDLGARLVLWYAAAPENVELSDAGDGTVTRWKDLSSFKLDSTLTIRGLSNGSSGPAAVFGDAGAAGNYLAFDHYSTELGVDSEQPNLEVGDREFLIEIVATMSTPGSPDVPLFARREKTLGHTGAMSLSIGPGGKVKVAINADDAGTQSVTSSNGTMSDQAAHVVAMRRIRQAALTTDSLQLRIDGVHEEAPVDRVNLDLVVADFFFGGNYPSPPHPPGIDYGYALRIAEIIVVAAKTAVPVTEAEVSAIEGYLKTKYRTP